MTKENKSDILFEEYDIKRVCYLYKNLDEFLPSLYPKCKTDEEIKIEGLKLQNFLEHIIMNNGKIEVHYKKKEGRSFGKNSIQGISNSVRNFLLENKGLVDIDIENAICAIMIPVFQKHNIKCNKLKYYYENRQEVIAKYYNNDKQKCKDFINSSFYKNADWIETNNKFEIKIKNEIKNFQDSIFELEEYENFRVSSQESCNVKNSDNFKGTMTNHIYVSLEDMLLNEATRFYKEQTNKKIITKMFDGFLSEEEKSFELQKLSTHIGELMNTGEPHKINYIYKPIKNDTTIIKSMPKDFIYDVRRIKSKYYLKKMKLNNIDIFDSSDGTYSEIINLFYSNDFIFQEEDIYIYYNNKWIQNNPHLIKSFIEEKLKDIYNIILNEFVQSKIESTAGTPGYPSLGAETQDEEQKKYDKKITDMIKVSKKIKYDATKNAILNSLKTNLSKRLDKIEFDVSLPYAICFNNKSFDIRTGEEIQIKKLDYITFTTGYDYVKPSDNDMYEIETIINNIFPNEENKKTYLSILWTCLCGVRQEKFFMANGGGRNGKGLINELMIITLGNDYSYTGHINTLTKELKSGANPELAQLNKKRFVKFEEPNDNDMLNLGNIKKITGEGFLNARNCNSNNTKCLLHLTAIFECNKRPNLNGTIDRSIIDRFVNIYFSSYFTSDEKELLENPNAKPINLNYKQLEWQQAIRCSFFDYIVKYAEKTLYISKEVKSQTREYLLDNDDMFSWFNTAYVKTEDESILSVKDILKEYKLSDFYYNLSKNDKRKNNEKNFKDKIMTNIELKKYYKDRYKNLRSVIIGWKLKPPEISIDED